MIFLLVIASEIKSPTHSQEIFCSSSLFTAKISPKFKITKVFSCIYFYLRYASLRYTTMFYAPLRCASLRYAPLRYASLRYASLRYAFLSSV